MSAVIPPPPASVTVTESGPGASRTARSAISVTWCSSNQDAGAKSSFSAGASPER